MKSAFGIPDLHVALVSRAWWFVLVLSNFHILHSHDITEGSLEVKLPTIWTGEKQSREEAERRERLEERRVEEIVNGLSLIVTDCPMEAPFYQLLTLSGKAGPNAGPRTGPGPDRTAHTRNACSTSAGNAASICISSCWQNADGNS